MNSSENLAIKDTNNLFSNFIFTAAKKWLTKYRGSGWTPWFLSSPLMVILIFLYLLPILYMCALAFFKKGGIGGIEYTLTFENFVRFFRDPWYLAVFWRTIYISIIATVITIFLAYIIAYYLVFYESRWKELGLILVISPILVGNIIRAFGWRVLISDSGAINDLLIKLNVINEPLRFLYTEHGVVIALASVLLPMAIMVLLGGLNNIDISLIEAAKSLGADRVNTFIHVTFPLSLPSISAASIICFVLSLGSFEIPLFIGGKRVPMMGPVIYEQITVVYNWPFGSALTLIVLVAALATAYLSNKILKFEYR